MDSILNSVKKTIGINQDDATFDTDIIIYINASLMSLQQLGVGPSSGYVVVDDTQLWSDLLSGRYDLESVKAYVSLKVKLMFDPPSTGYVVDAITRQISEFEWRINSQIEGSEII